MSLMTYTSEAVRLAPQGMALSKSWADIMRGPDVIEESAEEIVSRIVAEGGLRVV